MTYVGKELQGQLKIEMEHPDVFVWPDVIIGENSFEANSFLDYPEIKVIALSKAGIFKDTSLKSIPSSILCFGKRKDLEG